MSKLSTRVLHIVGVAVLCSPITPIFAFDFDEFLEGAGNISEELEAVDDQTRNDNRFSQQQLKSIRSQNSEYYNQSKIKTLRSQADQADRLKREQQERLAEEDRRNEERRLQEIANAKEQRYREEQASRQSAIIRNQQQIAENQRMLDQRQQDRLQQQLQHSRTQQTQILQEQRRQQQERLQRERQQRQQQQRQPVRSQQEFTPMRGPIPCIKVGAYEIVEQQYMCHYLECRHCPFPNPAPFR